MGEDQSTSNCQSREAYIEMMVFYGLLDCQTGVNAWGVTCCPAAGSSPPIPPAGTPAGTTTAARTMNGLYHEILDADVAVGVLVKYQKIQLLPGNNWYK